MGGSILIKLAGTMVIVAVIGSLTGCGSTPSPEAVNALAGPAVDSGTLNRSGTTVPERAQPSEKSRIIEAAGLYMEQQGLKVGNRQGEMALSVESAWEGMATVLYGFAGDELFGVLGLLQTNKSWKVIYDQARYPRRGEAEAPAAALARAQGYVFREEPGKFVLGVKEISRRQAVLLVAPYGEPWVWEYTLENRQDSWVITAKNMANERWEPVTDSPGLKN